MRSWTVLGAFAVLSALGVVVITLPDSGPRLAFSAAHGPGVLDAVGILLLLLGSAIFWWYLWKSRAAIKTSPARLKTLWTFGAGLGVGLLLASVANDFSLWWAIGAGLLVLVQLGLFVAASVKVPR